VTFSLQAQLVLARRQIDQARGRLAQLRAIHQHARTGRLGVDRETGLDALERDCRQL
jgi:hypothetical protein